jgi:chromosome segregation protein
MLKALELIGFKSFADRTYFEFPPGITAIVGPNGSGKSNVVDAIKWVLGEQSVKSLRGKEMADVIFNGSGSRGLQNTAEATLTFDNSSGTLAIDAAEVHVTRRVYRSGEGEYLINRQPCRLRDIRELFAGTGVSTEAYGVIEQGKVDILLQSSPRDRRIIFEEAAGISRFKAKKVESLRRLERVEQNLLRLADIVDEVDNQLRGVRKQAGKAQRYRQLSDRLKDLRLRLGVADWRRLGRQTDELAGQLATLNDEIASLAEASQACERQGHDLDRSLAEASDLLRQADARSADFGQQIAAAEATIEHERRRLADLENEIESHRRRHAGLCARAGDLENEWQAVTSSYDSVRRQRESLESRLANQRQHVAATQDQLDALRRAGEEQRAAYMNRMRLAASISNQITALDQRRGASQEALQRTQSQLAQIEGQLTAVAQQVALRRGDLERAEAMLGERQAALAQGQTRLNELRQQHEHALAELVAARERHLAARERAAVLQELQDRQEGVDTGARQLLELARQGEDAARHIKGLVADLLHAGLETAPAIDAVLGPVAQYVVVDSGQSIGELLRREAAASLSRVGFVCLDWLQASPAPVADLADEPGVLGRADELVETAADLRMVATGLLGKAWIVDTLERAFALLPKLAAESRLVTIAGEVVGPRGLVVAGRRQATSGLVSRRSELRALAAQLVELEGDVRRSQLEADALKTDLADQACRVERLAAEQLEAQHQVSELRAQLKELATTESGWRKQKRELEVEYQATAQARRQTESELSAARTQLQAIEAELATSEHDLSTTAKIIEGLESQRQAQADACTALEIEMAKADEQLSRLRLQMSQVTDSQDERRRALAEHAELLARHQERRQAALRTILASEAFNATLYLQKEQAEAKRAEWERRREALQTERAAVADRVSQLRGMIRQQEEEVHRRHLARRELELEQASIASRLRDDYQIDLAAVAQAEPDGDQELAPEEMQREIEELRRKINQMGPVNLDALTEMEALESRHRHLAGQYQDLAQAKSTLEQIINRINVDSRRLLAETFETVRGHFQELFAQLFGGGQADIVLEEGTDILEGGVEIVARPPGKEPRAISLLSGGEKTLTCVALLLAIFRSRPSPFCVLDEVDAALDEANIERFVSVLNGFLAWTQFIIITHSKKTMTCAHTLYGVTMEESGVSKRVSVRFEDVSEDGRILGPGGAFDEQGETQAA